MAGRPHQIRRAGEETGFTLVELVVAMVAGMVVIAALFSLVDVTLHQTTTTFSRVSATEQARVAMQRIEDALHSGCVAPSQAPVQPGSDANTLTFISAYGSSSPANPANAPAVTPVEHKIIYTPPTASATGTLVDQIFPETAVTSTGWAFSTTPSQTTTLLSNVTSDGANPVFQYFAYSEPMNGATPYTDAAGNTYMMIQDGLNYLPGSTTIKPAAAPLATPLTSASPAAAEVLVQLVVGPDGGSLTNTHLTDVGATVQDQIVLRLTPVNNHVGDDATFTPCD